jgi:hypothetical protein
VAFIAATVVLLAVAFALIHSPTSPLTAQAATFTLAALVFSIQLNTTRGGRRPLIQEEART